MKPTSLRIANLPRSGTMEIARETAKLRKQGREILSLSLGEPDFDTPTHIVEAAKESLAAGETHYSPAMGIPALREAIAEKSMEENGISCTPDNVMVAPTKHALFLATAALVDEGDEILISNPAWVSYIPQVMFTGGKPVLFNLGDGFSIEQERIQQAITPKTKAIIINSPSNPMGTVCSINELKMVADLAKDHDLWVITDEIYEKLVYEGKHVSIASLEGMAERTITLSGFSKSYAMTGWRLGWAVAPEEVLAGMLKLQEHTLTCSPVFVQKAGIAALKGPKEPLMKMLETFRERRKLVISLLENIPGVTLEKPMGAFYAFFRYGKDLSSQEMAKKILHEGGVAVTPGSAFGMGGEGYLRASYAASDERIRRAISGIEKVLTA
ncbi:MAG: pyridoxal phosphate-dependent aminotransferase [Candidatus Thermoplasmatota archaeon]|nr:pyridoxal phosphate-dependent aminotransferase [Candidatus Thermoplasmatota archaeon]